MMSNVVEGHPPVVIDLDDLYAVCVKVDPDSADITITTPRSRVTLKHASNEADTVTVSTK